MPCCWRLREAARRELPRKLGSSCPTRYPYVYEFEKALQLDPKNFELRREFAYLLLAMGKKDEAEQQFQILNQMAPEDLLSAAQLGFLRLNRHDYAGAQPLLDQVLKGDDEELADRVRVALKTAANAARHRGPSAQRTSEEAKDMAEKSMQAGYIKDALKYLTIAHENDPVDFAVMLKLGWVYNILTGRSARRSNGSTWRAKARMPPSRRKPDQAYRNLAPGSRGFRTTAWVFPFFSSRWHDAFGYGQMKTEMRLGDLPIRPYLSMRFVGRYARNHRRHAQQSRRRNISRKARSSSASASRPGLAWRDGWFEAGEAVKYLTAAKMSAP